MDDHSNISQQMPFLPFAIPDIGDEEIAAVVACMRTGWITTGPISKQFEQAFADYVGDNVEAIAVNSATAGLHLALEAIGIKEGDEVIVPTLTFTATAEVVRYLGAMPVFVDIDPCSMNISPAAIESAISPRTRAIVPVHYAGLACDMDSILALATKHRLRVVEDAAHAFPTKYRNQIIGTLKSDVVVFSFYANKTMTTGEGGMIVTRDPTLAQRMRMMRIHGINSDAFNRYISKTPAWYYEVVAAGFKYNLTDIAASIGIEQLRKIDRFLLRREYLAARYDSALSNLPLRLPPRAQHGCTHAWHLYVIRLTSSANKGRDEIIKLLSERGIGTSVHFIPLHRQPFWRDTYELRAASFPAADEVYQSMITLPLYTRMSDVDQDRVIDEVRKVLA